MKTRHIKYEEAIARNFASFMSKTHEELKKLAKRYTVPELKHKIGIRSTDPVFDAELHKLGS